MHRGRATFASSRRSSAGLLATGHAAEITPDALPAGLGTYSSSRQPDQDGAIRTQRDTRDDQSGARATRSRPPGCSASRGRRCTARCASSTSTPSARSTDPPLAEIVPEWDSAVAPMAAGASRYRTLRRRSRRTRCSSRSIVVRTGSCGSGPARLHPNACESRSGDDISSGEGSRALFESGAAVQQVGVDFLISTDWLRRHAVAASTIRRTGTRVSPSFTRRVAADEGRYMEPFEAIRVARGPIGTPARPRGPSRRWPG